MPVPVPPGIGLLETSADVTMPSFSVEQYRWTGSIRDDGTRVFQVS